MEDETFLVIEHVLTLKLSGQEPAPLFRLNTCVGEAKLHEKFTDLDQE